MNIAPVQLNQVASLGEDAGGEVYMCEYAGRVWKIMPFTSSGPGQ